MYPHIGPSSINHICFLVAHQPITCYPDIRVEVEVAIALAVDLKRLKLDSFDARQRCDDPTSFAEYCSLIPDLEANPDPNAYASLDDMISQNGNEFPVSRGKLSPKADGLKVLSYNISTTGVYCATLQFFGKNLLKSMNSRGDQNLISVKWLQAHGLLSSYELYELTLEYYSCLAQVVLIIVYGSYIFKKVSDGRANAAVSSINSVYQRSLIQFKILIFLVGSSAYYLIHYLYFRHKNIYGAREEFFTSRIFYTRKFLPSFITIVFSTWAIYNFLLLSSGVLFGYYVDSKRMLLVKVILVALLIEQIANEVLSRVFLGFGHTHILDWIMYILQLLVFCLGTFWVRDIYKKLENRILKRKLATTYILIFLAYFFYFAFASTQVEYKFRRKLREAEIYGYSASVTSRVFTFIVCAFIALSKLMIQE